MEQMERYVETARRRAQEKREQLHQRHEQAWEVARTAARLLKDEFSAGQVAVFGSLLRPELFHSGSDIDLAVWGLDQRLYFRALARLLDIDPSFSIDLVEFELASPRLQKHIEEEGQLL